MEIPSSTIVDLVKGQGRIEQALLDMGSRLDRALPILEGDQDDLETRIGKVENKIWYMSGVSTAVGFGISSVIAWLKR